MKDWIPFNKDIHIPNRNFDNDFCHLIGSASDFFNFKPTSTLLILPQDSGERVVRYFTPMVHRFSSSLLPFSFYSIPLHYESCFIFQIFISKDSLRSLNGGILPRPCANLPMIELRRNSPKG